LQFVVLILTVGNAAGINSPKIKVAYELMTSMNAPATFVAFGTQKNVLQAWKFWGKKKSTVVVQQQPQGGNFPAEWAEPQQREPMQFDEEAFVHSPADGIFKPWLRAGEHEKMGGH